MIRLLGFLTLIVTGVCDAVTKKIPDLFPGLITVLAICQILTDPSYISARVVGMLVLSLPMLLLALRFGGLGGGDIKLTAACGLFLGTDAVLMGGFFAAVLALLSHYIFFLYQRLLSYRERRFRYDEKRGQRSAQKQLCRTLTSPFAFGPYLAAGFILASLL